MYYWKTSLKISRNTCLFWIIKQKTHKFVFNRYYLTLLSGCVTNIGRVAMDTGLLKASAAITAAFLLYAVTL